MVMLPDGSADSEYSNTELEAVSLDTAADATKLGADVNETVRQHGIVTCSSVANTCASVKVRNETDT